MNRRKILYLISLLGVAILAAPSAWALPEEETVTLAITGMT